MAEQTVPPYSLLLPHRSVDIKLYNNAIIHSDCSRLLLQIRVGRTLHAVGDGTGGGGGGLYNNTLQFSLDSYTFSVPLA